jgi:hypothetical protein
MGRIVAAAVFLGGAISITAKCVILVIFNTTASVFHVAPTASNAVYTTSA